jgi:hypothetical protein
MNIPSCNDFKFVSCLYFTKDLHCDIINELLGSNIVLNKEPFETIDGEIYVTEPDFHLISSKVDITIYWLNLDYERINEYNNRIVKYLGVNKYYWDIYDRESNEFIAECRSGVFELNGEISISDKGNPGFPSCGTRGSFTVNRKYDNIIDTLPDQAT